MSDVSIIIVNWNTRDILRQCLDSVFAATSKVSFEVIAVDNGSADGSVEMVRSEFPEVVLIANRENRGFAAANNQGIKRSRGRYVLLLNSDTVVLDGAIEDTVAYADGYPDAGAVGCKILDAEGIPQHEAFMYPSLLNICLSLFPLGRVFPHSRVIHRERMSWRDLNAPAAVPAVAGCFMLVRRAVLQGVGILDPSYFMFAEETDWCWRMVKAGWKILYYPGASIIHYGGRSRCSLPVRMYMHEVRSVIKFILKREGYPAAVLANWLLVATHLIRLIGWCAAWVYEPCRALARERLALAFGALGLELGLAQL